MSTQQANIIVRIVTLKDRLLATDNPLREESCRNEIIRLHARLEREREREIMALATPNQQERLESVYG